MLIWKNKLHGELGCGIPDLLVKADATAGPQFCRDRVANIQQLFKPSGSIASDSSRMVYKAEFESSNHTWYFYEMESGEWEFTSDSIDINPAEYGTRKLKSINATKMFFFEIQRSRLHIKIQLPNSKQSSRIGHVSKRYRKYSKMNQSKMTKNKTEATSTSTDKISYTIYDDILYIPPSYILIYPVLK